MPLLQALTGEQENGTLALLLGSIKAVASLGSRTWRGTVKSEWEGGGGAPRRVASLEDRARMLSPFSRV